MHISPASKQKPLLAQTGALESFGKAFLNGILFGVNPVFLFLISGKISGPTDG